MCKTSVSREKQIEYIMAHFDFERVHDVMTLFDWKWIGRRGLEVPTVEWIKASALRLLDQVSENETIRAGRFCAADSDGRLFLSFEIEWQLGSMAKYWEGDLTP